MASSWKVGTCHISYDSTAEELRCQCPNLMLKFNQANLRAEPSPMNITVTASSSDQPTPPLIITSTTKLAGDTRLVATATVPSQRSPTVEDIHTVTIFKTDEAGRTTNYYLVSERDCCVGDAHTVKPSTVKPAVTDTRCCSRRWSHKMCDSRRNIFGRQRCYTLTEFKQLTSDFQKD